MGRFHLGKTLATLLACLLWIDSSRGDIGIVRDELPTPAPHPRSELDFDSTTNSFWSVSNELHGPINNFLLDGTAAGEFSSPVRFDNNGLGVNNLPGDNFRVYVWGNSNLLEFDRGGTLRGQTSLHSSPEIYANVYTTAFDPVTGMMVLPHRGVTTTAGFHFVQPGVGVVQILPFDLEGPGGAGIGPVVGMHITATDYWLLGSESWSSAGDKIVRVDRDSMQVVGAYYLPDSLPGQQYKGLTYVPSTGFFYSHYASQTIRALELTVPEPAAMLLIWSAAVLSIVGKCRSREFQNLIGNE